MPAVVLRSEVDGRQFRLALNPLLTLADVAYAFAHEGSDTAQKVVAIQLTPEGRRRFAEATERLIGHQLGVVLGGRLLQVPGVRSALMGPVPVTDLPVPAADADALIRRLNELARGNK